MKRNISLFVLALVGFTLFSCAGAGHNQEKEIQGIVETSESATFMATNDALTIIFRSDIFFDTNRAVIKPGGYAEINRLIGVLNRYPTTSIHIEGHTDIVGPEGFNEQLSERRANAVRTALVRRGVDPQRIDTGVGEAMPVSSSNAANRRVNVIITPISG